MHDDAPTAEVEDTRERRFRRLVVGTFLAAAAAKAVLHEPWRDELVEWGAAQDSPDVSGYFAWARTIGHGPAWSAIVFLVQRLLGDVRALQILPVLLTTIAVYTTVRWAPFSRLQKVLFALGFLPFFEWGVLARPYGLTFAAAVTSCALATARPPRPVAVGLALAVTAATTVYGLIVAAAIGCAFAVHSRRDPAERPGASRARWIAGALLVAASAALSLWFLVPAGSLGGEAAWRFDVEASHVRETLGGVVEAFVPLRGPGVHFRTGGWALLAPLILGAITWAFVRRPAALTLWLVGVAGLVAFAHLRFEGAARHRGHLFLVFVLAAWTAALPRTDGSRRHRAGAALLTILLAAQVPAGLWLAARDAALAFSVSGDVARTLRERGLAEGPIVADPVWLGAPIAVLLGRPVTFASTGATASTFGGDPRTYARTADDVVGETARALAARTGRDVAVLVDRELPEGFAGGRLLFRVAPGMVRDETYWVHVVPPR